MPSIARFDIWQNTAGVARQSVLQTVFFTDTTRYSYTPGAGSGGGTASPTLETAMGITITPQFASSKILIMGQIWASTTSAGSVCNFLFKRNGTTIFTGSSATYDNMTTGFYVNGGSDYPWITLPVCFLDSPGITTAATYKLWAMSGNGGTIFLNRRTDSWGAGPTNFVAMEIAQ